MPRQTISEAIDARLAFLKQAQEERDLRLIIDELVGAGFTGSTTTAYVLENPRGLDIKIAITTSMRAEHVKPITLLVEVEKSTELDAAFRYFPVYQWEPLFEYIISEIDSAELL